MKDNEALRLERIKEKNFFVFSKIATYLNNFPTLITKEIMDEICGGVAENEERAFGIFLANMLTDKKEEINLLEKEYLPYMVKKLNAEEYTSDPYYKNIKIPEKSEGKWSFGYQVYQPYEGFIYKDILVKNDYKEMPQLGFFSSEFYFPAVFENGIEWMAIKPNEIETMKEPIEKMQGNVVVFGLGLGYFAYLTSLKQNVERITIIERDEEVIKLFSENILPQFENKDKIKIVKSDAFDYVQSNMKNEKFNHAFVDLWHDVSDGVELYLKMKRLEASCPNTEFSYWIEKSIISNIRWRIFDNISLQLESGKSKISSNEIKKYLSDTYLKNFVKFI